MSRYTGPRLRIMRALGVNLPGLSSKSIERRPRPPGQHGLRIKRTTSLHAKRLKEKQKLRFHYGVTERQLRTLAAVAARSRVASGDVLVQLLERRLDNLVFRAGFARTIPAARQLVRHGHVLVNGRVVDIPSARLRRGDVIAVRPRAHVIVRQHQARGQVLVCPEWIELQADSYAARLAALPPATATPFPIDIGLVVEFYA